MTKSTLIYYGFLAAGLANIGGVLVATQGFSSPVVAQHYPAVFSDFGMLAIILWGLAYIAVARAHAAVPWLVAVFAIEKAVYVLTWVVWMNANSASLAAIQEQSVTAWLFYLVYGANDLVFGLFFAWVFLTRRSHG